MALDIRAAGFLLPGRQALDSQVLRSRVVLTRAYETRSGCSDLRHASSILGREASLVMQNLKLDRHNPVALDRILKEQVPRLLEKDLLNIILQLRMIEPAIAFKVFQVMRKEVGYEPSVWLYRVLMKSLCWNGHFEELTSLLQLMKADGLKPYSSAYHVLLKHCVTNGLPERALDIFRQARELFDIMPSRVLMESVADQFIGKDRKDLAAEIRGAYVPNFSSPASWQQGRYYKVCPERQERYSLWFTKSNQKQKPKK